MFNSKGDLEHEPGKADAGKQNDAEKASEHSGGFDFGKSIRQFGDAVGKAQNDLIERVTNVHVKQQYVASISPALASQYARGRDIVLSRTEAGKSTSDLSDLNASERQAAQTYQRLHSDLPSKIPFYNKETLAIDLDRDIVRKARSQPQAVAEAKREPSNEIRPSAPANSRSEPKAAAALGKSEAKLDSRPSAKPESKYDSKPDSKLEPKPDSKFEPKLASKLEPKSEPKSDSRSELKAESRQDAGLAPSSSSSASASSFANAGDKAVAPQSGGKDNSSDAHFEQKYASNGNSAERLAEKSSSQANLPNSNSADRTSIPGNALLTALSSYKVEPKSKPDASSDAENKPRANGNSNANLNANFSKNQTETKGTPEKQNLHGDALNSLSVQLNNRLPSAIRLCAVSESHAFKIFQNCLVPLVRHLSDRTASATIRIPVSFEQQIGGKLDSKPEPNSAPRPSGKSETHIAVSKSQLPVRNSSQEVRAAKAESKAEPTFETTSKPDSKLDARAEIKTTLGATSKPTPISDSKPSSDLMPSQGVKLKPNPKSNPNLVSEAKQEFALAPNTSPVKVSEPKAFGGYRVKCEDADQKYLTGPEIALSAIIALASIAKLRTDQSIWQGDSVAMVQSFGFEGYAASFVPTNDQASKSESAHLPLDTEIKTSRVLFRPRILIGPGDTLVSLAEQLFNDGSIAWLILKLNTDLEPLLIEGKTVVRVRSRQEIFIPVYQDIIDFQKIRTKEMNGHNLITVVEDNQVDREIVDIAMAPMLGYNSSNVDPLQTAQSLHSLQLEQSEQSLVPLQIVADDEA